MKLLKRICNAFMIVGLLHGIALGLVAMVSLVFHSDISLIYKAPYIALVVAALYVAGKNGEVAITDESQTKE